MTKTIEMPNLARFTTYIEAAARDFMARRNELAQMIHDGVLLAYEERDECGPDERTDATLLAGIAKWLEEAAGQLSAFDLNRVSHRITQAATLANRDPDQSGVLADATVGGL